MKKRHIFLGLALMVGLSACYDLDKEPEGVLSSATPFTSTGEMRNYLDQFYETAVRSQGFSAGGGSGIAGNDVNSDNMAASSVDSPTKISLFICSPCNICSNIDLGCIILSAISPIL